MRQDTFNNVYMYTRVSTPKQADTGLPRQDEECRDGLQKLKITTFEEYVDIGSSYRNSNALSNLNRLLRKIQKNDLIVIARISRLGRNVLQVISALEKVRRKGGIIYAVYENLFWNKNKYENTKFQNIVIKAREKSDILSMKARDTYNYITSNNGYYGKPSYGFSIERNENNIPILVPNDDEIKIINFIKDQYENKKSTFYHIATTLNNKGINKRGYEWNVLNVKRVYQYNLIDMDSSMNSVYQPDSKPLTRSSSGTLLHRSGSASSLHRSNSASAFSAYKKHSVPDSPTQPYKSKFKTSKMSINTYRGGGGCDGGGCDGGVGDGDVGDGDGEQEQIQTKMKKLDITPKRGYGCSMF
jgi:putative DNA-invertase from lambdoid prophage Rac